MASLNLEPDEYKSLDQVRMRLVQITRSIDSLRQTVASTYPFPDPGTLQASHNIIQRHLKSLNQVLEDNAELFNQVAVHPSSNFDGRKYEHILQNLLRKKLEPVVEIRAEEGREAAMKGATGADGDDALGDMGMGMSLGGDMAGGMGGMSMGGGAGGGGSDDTQRQQDMVEKEEALKQRMAKYWIQQEDRGIRMRQMFGTRLADYVESEERSLFTKSEKEMAAAGRYVGEGETPPVVGDGLDKVRTGLRRDLVREERAMFEDESDEEEENEDEDEDVAMVDAGGGGGGMGMDVNVGAQQQQQQQRDTQPPECMLFFGATGGMSLPANLDLTSEMGPEEGSGKGKQGQEGRMPS